MRWSGRNPEESPGASGRLLGRRRHEAERSSPIPFFTERSLAAYLAVSDRTIRNWIRRGELPATSSVPSRRIDPADVEDLPFPTPGRGRLMRRESPVKRTNPSGEVVWVARYTGRDGKHHIAKPSWNRGKGTFARKAEAQKAIEEAYGLSGQPRHAR